MPDPAPARIKQRPLAVRDGLPLGVVQAGEKGFELGGGVCHGSISTVAGAEVVSGPARHASEAVPDVLTDLRSACATVAETARYVRIDRDRTSAYIGTLPVGLPAPEPDPDAHVTTGTREEQAAFWLTLDAINFGSGWFPTLRKRDGRSGYYTVATGVRDRFAAAGPWSRAMSSARSTPTRSRTRSARTPTTS